MTRFSDLAGSEQEALKSQIKQLIKEGLGFKRIKRTLLEKGISISTGTLSYWKNNPLSKIQKNTFKIAPSQEMSYFLGVMFGDGNISIHKSNYDYCIQLGAIDKEFVEKFSHCVTTILNKTTDYPVHFHKPNMFHTNIRSKELYEFVRAAKINFDLIKPLIEVFPADFIQGLADSEGCPIIKASNRFGVRLAIAASTNFELLEYTQNLLIRFFTIKSALRLAHKIGQSDSKINGRILTRTKNLFSVETLKFEDTLIFHKKICFSIIRKQKKLTDAIGVIYNYSEKAQLKRWKEIYFKGKKQWLPKQSFCPIKCVEAPPPGFEPGSHP